MWCAGVMAPLALCHQGVAAVFLIGFQNRGEIGSFGAEQYVAAVIAPAKNKGRHKCS